VALNYFKVAGVDYDPPAPDGGITYTEAATRGVTYRTWDGRTATRVQVLTAPQRVKTGRLVVATSAAQGGVLTTAELATLRAALEAATSDAPVRVETNCNKGSPLDGYFVLEPNSELDSTPVTPMNDHHAWSATLLRVS
jgi:hypothetical protein